MKHVFCVIFFLLFSVNCRADVPKAVINRYRQIVKLIKDDDATALAKLIQYPLKRQNPLADIATAKDFIAYYNTLFDAAFKTKLKRYHDSVILEHNGVYGLVGGPFDGDIWLNEQGKIMGINYSSKREQQLQAQLKIKTQQQIHPSVGTWKQNVLVARSAKLLIRIDRTTRGLRYVSWSNNRPMWEKPDLILFNGTEEAQGTMGGWTWTFKNNDWTYTVDDVEMCENPKQCGLFLRLANNGADKSAIRLKAIK